MKIFIFTIALICLVYNSEAQNITVYPNSSSGEVSEIFAPGIFFVPKTVDASNDFFNNGIQFNSIRLISIETALNYPGVKSINDVMTILEGLKPSIMIVNARCKKLCIPIMKMPLWLSASKNTNPIPNSSDPNWKIFHAYPPADYKTWNLLMDSIVDKFNNQWGLDPYYEIWNEPDNFYWQDTPESYFTFFKNTYKAIRENHKNARIGGPSVSSFASCFKNSLPNGYLSDSLLNQTIIARLIDSCVAWNTKLDFISWHKFDPLSRSFHYEIPFLDRKLISSGHGIVRYYITEWNQTSSLRDTPFSTAIMTNNILKMSKFGISGQMVAAWQDFDSSSKEFHQDYGLLSYGSLYKPEWDAMLLLEKIKGKSLKYQYSDTNNISIVSAFNNDTLRILVSNYQLPAFIETLAKILDDNKLNSDDFIKSGITSNTLIDSIFKGLIVLPNKNSLSLTLNLSPPLYKRNDSLLNFGRNIDIRINGLIGNHNGRLFLIDSTNNNQIHAFDSLINTGYSRQDAVTKLKSHNDLKSNEIQITDSLFSFHIQANAVALIEFYVPDLTEVSENFKKEENIEIIPNPACDYIEIKGINHDIPSQNIKIYNSFGETIEVIYPANSCYRINVTNYRTGLYYIKVNNSIQKFLVLK